MLKLPISDVLSTLKKQLDKRNRLVLQAPPGAGKTTALPLALLDEAWLEGKKIIMLEPRRLAVRSSAARMAELLGEKVGERIGYQIKMESVYSERTKILIVTEGVLVRKLQADPSLEAYALVIFDEFHERSIHADLSLALTLESQMLLRDDLKVLVMSATLNTSGISALMDNAPIVQSEGRSFPVEEVYLDTKTAQPGKKELPEFIFTMLQTLLREEEGSILIFLPGVAEIKRLEILLKKGLQTSNIYVSPLYGKLSKEAQDKAIKAPEDGSRKIVISTNISQTSLTIEGISLVIDSGLQNSSLFDPSSGMDRLHTRFISEDAAIQRSGRAGRLSAGKCYRLWHRGKILDKHDKAEILYSDLTPLMLELGVWGNEDVSELSWMDLPPKEALEHARELLFYLGAFNSQGKITQHGQKMASFGMHPRLSHMMIKAKEEGLGYEASLLCALLNEKDIYRSGLRSCDMGERVSILHSINVKEGEVSADIDRRQCQYVLQEAKRLYPDIPSEPRFDKVGQLLSLAYPDRIGQRRRKGGGEYLLANGKGARLNREEVLFDEAYLVVSDLDGSHQNALIYKAARVSRDEIEQVHTGEIITTEELKWNIDHVEAREISSLGALVLEQKALPLPSDERVSTLLLENIVENGLSVLPWSKPASELRDRINFVNAHREQLHDPLVLPDFSEAALLKDMPQWLLPYLEGRSSFQSLADLDLFGILSARLDWDTLQELERLAPSRMKVASGSEIRIDYSDPLTPVLAVRLQEMFGTKTTPSVLGGKVKLMLHLLSPAHRPMQVTQDLENFWKSTYTEVKKELRGKYKKHYWPDDPLCAQATSKTKRFM